MGSNFMEIGAVAVNFNGNESPPFVISSRKENNNILIASAFGGFNYKGKECSGKEMYWSVDGAHGKRKIIAPRSQKF
ncbi:hypothetical protein CUMW_099970 [Citrus unshiu]|nr:hypothetical protein CUMW_099970 [Citrus unshiu]